MARGRNGMSRRRFLKAGAAGAFALGSIPTIIVPRRVEAYQAGGQVHPNISPLRVAGLQDPSMTTDLKPRSSWGQQEELVAWDVVQQNVDKLAVALAQEADPAAAWKKILVKPPGKSWGDTVVAIKTNHLGQQHTRSAVMSKVCRVLTDVMGVKGSNVHIYDGKTGGGLAKSTPFANLPEGVAIRDTWGGIGTRTAVPEPYAGGRKQAACVGHFVKDEVDILVNISMCKGHGPNFGQFTMAMKNHFGTFDPGPSHAQGGGADYLIGINKTPEILGRMDPATGNVLFPRQQLCLVDALWASRPGPGAPPDSQPNAMTMGTFGPAVDYVTAVRLRRDVMGWPVNMQVARRFLSEFGFSESDLPNNGQLVNALA